MNILDRLRKIRLEINLLTEEYSNGNIAENDYERILVELKSELDRLNNIQVGSNFINFLKNKFEA